MKLGNIAQCAATKFQRKTTAVAIGTAITTLSLKPEHRTTIDNSASG